MAALFIAQYHRSSPEIIAYLVSPLEVAFAPRIIPV